MSDRQARLSAWYSSGPQYAQRSKPMAGRPRNNGEDQESFDLRVLDFIDFWLRDNCYNPTVRDIAEGVGVRSTSTVQSAIERLERAGHIVREDHKARTLRVVPDRGRE